MLSLPEARSLILRRAEPAEAVETALLEALGLVLAEPVEADVDLPPFDRAALDGYAVRAADASGGGRLAVVGVGPDRPRRGDGVELAPGQAAWVAAGAPLPVGADALLRAEDARPDPPHGRGRPRFVEPIRPAEPGRNVLRRRALLAAGTPIAPAGARLHAGMVGLLAAQGCVHPVCHRRARVAVLAVGDDLVGPGDAPVLSRERNAANLMVMAPLLGRGASALDLGVVPEEDVDAALDRALSAPVALVLAPPEGAAADALRRKGVEFLFEGLALHPGKRAAYGVVLDDSGRVATHVLHLPNVPVAALAASVLLAGPLVARLQGADPSSAAPGLRALWDGTHRATDDRAWAVPVALTVDDSARCLARPVPYRGAADLSGLAAADALAVLPPESGPWSGGEPVEVVPLGPWDGI